MLDSLEEGILYSKKQVQELKYEEAKETLEDITLGIISIKDAIQPILQHLSENDILELETKLLNNFNKIISSYKYRKEVELEKLIGEGLLITFNHWKEALEKALLPYIVS